MYNEISARPPIADRAECMWIGTEEDTAPPKRVLPDGCADIIYTRRAASSNLIIVGPMSVYQDFPQDAHSCSVAIRFRPGRWNQLLRVDARQLTDGTMPLEDVWGQLGRTIQRSLDAVECPVAIARMLAKSMPNIDEPHSPVQRVISALENSHGHLSLDTAAQQSGLSARQFRRRCLESTGLTPNLLARILRFRRATQLLASAAGNDADLAYECGYSDQSHLIAEFRRFAGRTPRELAQRYSDGV